MAIKPFLILLLLSGCFSAVFGQPTPNPRDTTYVFRLLEKGEALENKKTDVALKYFQKAYDFSKKKNYTKGYFDSVRLLAYNLNNLGRHDEAQVIADEALRRAKQDTSRRNLGLSYFAVANTALFKGNYSQAIPNYHQAARYMKAIGKLGNVAVVNQNLGYIYLRQKMYEKALEYYGRALAYDSTDKSDPRSVAIDYQSIANVLSGQEKMEESRAYLLKALQYAKQEKDLNLMIPLYDNLSWHYHNESKYDSAMYYQREGLRMSRELGNPSHELHMLMMLALSHNRTEKHTQAIALLDKAYAIAQRDKAGYAELRNIYGEYSIANESLGNYKAATEWLNLYIDTNDSMNNEGIKTMLQEYELKIDKAENRERLAVKQQRIDQLELKDERQKFWLLVAALAGFVVIGGLLFAYLYAHQRRLVADSALLAAQRENELATVQSELQGQKKERMRISKEMHDDLGASLTAIGLLSEVAKRRGGAEAIPEIEKISTISAEMVTAMNEIIWSLNTKNDSLNGLIAYTRSYASEFIDNTDLLLRTHVAESPYELTMRGADRRNVFLTVKEALNNVVKHAQASEVRLTIQPEKDQLLIEVRDNGRGFVASIGPSTRNGLGNMRDRMREVGGECEIISSVKGTSVKITYPYPFVPKTKIMQMQYSE